MRANGELADKPGRLLPEDCALAILEDLNPYVSRGGLKLEHALKAFQVSPAGKTCLDIGASTGGFTDCLIQQNALKVFAVDVGYGQLDWKLRNDPRVAIIERKNARAITLDDLKEKDASLKHIDLVVIDVSFISLNLVMPPAFSLLSPEGDIIALVKPQFEVGRHEVENKGIIKSPDKHMKVLFSLRDFIARQGWAMLNLASSPIMGQKGNREFLIHCRQRGEMICDESIKDVVFPA